MDIVSDVLEQQTDLKDRAYGAAELLFGISRLSKLEEVTMSFGRGLPRVNPENNPYDAMMASADSAPFVGYQAGVRQAISLIAALRQAGTKLEALRLGYLSWQLFVPDVIKFARDVLNSLKMLEVAVFTRNVENDALGELSQRERFLQGNEIHDVFTAAPNLVHLEITCIWFGYPSPLNLKNLVQSFIWRNLRELFLEKIVATETDWLYFFGRHPTLSKISLQTITLLDGEWSVVLEDMQKCLTKLTEVSLRYTFNGNDPPHSYGLSPKFSYETYSDMKLQPNRTRVAIEKFLVEGGECQLRNEVEHPPTS